MCLARNKVATVANAGDLSPDGGWKRPPITSVPLFSTCCIKPLDRCASASEGNLAQERAAHRPAAHPE